MFKIGDFSRLTLVTVKALRHYDRLGLLKPAEVDPATGYRFYTSAQLPQLNRILALKELGFSLDQIKHLLEAELSPPQFQQMFRRKEEEVRNQIAVEEFRLARLRMMLQQLDHESELPRYDVLIKSVPAMRLASIRAVIPTHGNVQELFRELAAYQLQHELAVTGGMVIWHDHDFRDHEVDTEAAFITPDRITPQGRVQPNELPAVGTMASISHHGPPSTIGEASMALLRWIEVNGYRLDGPERTHWLHRDGQNDNDTLTEIQYPVVLNADEPHGRSPASIHEVVKYGGAA